MPIQISRLNGFSVYMTQLWEVSKRKLLFGEIITMYFPVFFTLAINLINLCFYSADKVKFVCLTTIINFAFFVVLHYFFLSINKCQFYSFCLISLTLN